MPAKNPVLELIKRELLSLSGIGTYQERISLFENFKQRPVLAATLDPATINQAALRLYTGANKDWNISGTNAADADSAIDVNGGCSLATAGADNDQIILSPAAAVNSVAQSPWGTIEWQPEHSSRFETQIELGALTNVLVHAGFVLTTALDLTTDADQVKFQFSPEGAVSTTNWTAITSIGGTDVETDTAVAGVAASTIRLGIEINSNRVPRMYINGTKVYTGSALTAGVNLIPVIGFQALAAAVKTNYVRANKGSRLVN